jgi:hypothetical protein
MCLFCWIKRSEEEESLFFLLSKTVREALKTTGNGLAISPERSHDHGLPTSSATHRSPKEGRRDRILEQHSQIFLGKV